MIWLIMRSGMRGDAGTGRDAALREPALLSQLSTFLNRTRTIRKKRIYVPLAEMHTLHFVDSLADRWGAASAAADVHHGYGQRGHGAHVAEPTCAHCDQPSLDRQRDNPPPHRDQPAHCHRPDSSWPRLPLASPSLDQNNLDSFDRLGSHRLVRRGRHEYAAHRAEQHTHRRAWSGAPLSLAGSGYLPTQT